MPAFLNSNFKNDKKRGYYYGKTYYFMEVKR